MQKTMSGSNLLNDYERKIEIILGNKLEYNGDNQKAIEDVKAWVTCEWQCGMIEEMSLCVDLLNRVPLIANRMIREL